MILPAKTFPSTMRDAVVIGPTFGLAALATMALAIAPRPAVTPAASVAPPEPIAVAEVVSDPACVVSGATADRRRALELACLQYGDSEHHFEVFSTATHGFWRAVFVRRQTGVCGGCGALAVAVIFRGDEIELVD